MVYILFHLNRIRDDQRRTYCGFPEFFGSCLCNWCIPVNGTWVHRVWTFFGKCGMFCFLQFLSKHWYRSNAVSCVPWAYIYALRCSYSLHNEIGFLATPHVTIWFPPISYLTFLCEHFSASESIYRHDFSGFPFPHSIVMPLDHPIAAAQSIDVFALVDFCSNLPLAAIDLAWVFSNDVVRSHFEENKLIIIWTFRIVSSWTFEKETYIWTNTHKLPMYLRVQSSCHSFGIFFCTTKLISILVLLLQTMFWSHIQTFEMLHEHKPA